MSDGPANAGRGAGTDPKGGAVALARMMRDLVEILIPGDETWPSAAMAGIHGVLAFRLLETRGEAGVTALAEALAGCGAPFEGLDEVARIAVVERLEAEYPVMFAEIRGTVFLSYYESPIVVRALRMLGQPYKLVPIEEGYPLPPFDLAADRPRHNRGHWVPTEAVRRVDLGRLDHLGGADDRA